jgi:hypothetical protein
VKLLGDSRHRPTEGDEFLKASARRSCIRACGAVGGLTRIWGDEEQAGGSGGADAVRRGAAPRGLAAHEGVDAAAADSAQFGDAAKRQAGGGQLGDVRSDRFRVDERLPLPVGDGSAATPLRIAVGGAAWPATAAVAPIGAECAVVVRRRLVVAVAAETRGRSLLGARRFLWLRRGRRLAELCR